MDESILKSPDLLNTFLYIYGIGFIQPQNFLEYPKLKTIKPEKIFELCHVASVYGFVTGNPKHPLRMDVIRKLQQDTNAAEDLRQLAAFMVINYNNDILNDLVNNLQCTKTGAIMHGVTNWLLLELIGNHKPWEVVQLSSRIGKFLCALTFEDLIEKQMKPILDMLKEGISLSDISKYFTAKQIIEFSKYI